MNYKDDFDYSEKPKGKPNPNTFQRLVAAFAHYTDEDFYNSRLARGGLAVIILGILAAGLVIYKLNEPTVEDVRGYWAGLLYQDTGGFSPAYHFKLAIYPDDHNQVTGTAEISIGDSNPSNLNGIDDAYYGVMRFEGEFRDGVLYIWEQTLIENDVMNGWQWCIKDYQLKLDGDILSGEWQAPRTPGCAPGTMILERQPDNGY